MSFESRMAEAATGRDHEGWLEGNEEWARVDFTALTYDAALAWG
jgi:hypothetical protein